jgi:hypothetical protein
MNGPESRLPARWALHHTIEVGQNGGERGLQPTCRASFDRRRRRADRLDRCGRERLRAISGRLRRCLVSDRLRALSRDANFGATADRFCCRAAVRISHTGGFAKAFLRSSRQSLFKTTWTGFLRDCNPFENGKPLDRSDRRHYEDVASNDREVLQVRGLQVVWSGLRSFS